MKTATEGSNSGVERLKSGRFSYLKNDLPAGMVVFLVALPLCTGAATATGAPVFSGILSGVIGGIIVTALSGSALTVSGPATALAVIAAGAIQSMGTFEAFLMAVVLSGVFQLIFAAVGLGQFRGALAGKCEFAEVFERTAG